MSDGFDALRALDDAMRRRDRYRANSALGKQPWPVAGLGFHVKALVFFSCPLFARKRCDGVRWRAGPPTFRTSGAAWRHLTRKLLLLEPTRAAHALHLATTE